VRECTEGEENSWKEPCSCHRARRLPVRSVPVTQGKGDWQSKDCLGDREGALSWGGTDHVENEGLLAVSVGDSWESFLPGDCVYAIFPVTSA
jgi:hypothetical protein